MYFADVPRFGLIPIVVCATIACGTVVRTVEADVEPAAPVVREGPSAALEFERSFRDADYYEDSKPIPLDQCENITELTEDFWSKKHVLLDFKRRRTAEQIGVIVIIKTEYCCTGSRLCAVTTASMEKKSTPLIGRFLVYAGWIKNNPDRSDEQSSQWDEDVISEYDFIQGPGARMIVMVPTWDGKMYQWHSTATDLDLTEADFESNQGATPGLESFLQECIKHAPAEIPATDLSEN